LYKATRRHIPKTRAGQKEVVPSFTVNLFDTQNISSFPSCFLTTFQLAFRFSRVCYIPRQSHSPNIFRSMHIIKFLVRPRQSLGQPPITSWSKYSPQRTYNFMKEEQNVRTSVFLHLASTSCGQQPEILNHFQITITAPPSSPTV